MRDECKKKKRKKKDFANMIFLNSSDNASVCGGILVDQLNEEIRDALLPVTVFVGLELIIGILGNLLVLYVFLKHYHTCNYKYFVLCLATNDILSCFTALSGEMVSHYYWYNYPSQTLCKVKSFFNVLTVSSEAFCLLVIAVDRYLKVCKPHSRQIKPAFALCLCCLIFVVGLCMALPVSFFWGTHSSQQVFNNVNVTVTMCDTDPLFQHTKHPLQYSVTVEVLLSGCLAVMFGLYIAIVRNLLTQDESRVRLDSECSANSLRRWKIRRVKADGKDIAGAVEFLERRGADNGVSNTDQLDMIKNQVSLSPLLNVKLHTGSTVSSKFKQMKDTARRKTIIMLILTIIFIVTLLVYLTLLSFIAKSSDFLRQLNKSERIVYLFFFRLYFINHVSNPIVYGFLDPRFKALFTDLKKFCARS